MIFVVVVVVVGVAVGAAVVNIGGAMLCCG